MDRMCLCARTDYCRDTDVCLCLTALLQIPSNIPKPDYFKGGVPNKEIESKQQRMGACVLGARADACF